MSENNSAAEYLNNLLKQPSDFTVKTKKLLNELKEKDMRALEYTAKLSYSFQLPIDVTCLAFSLVVQQIRHGENPNAMKMLQSLTRNQRRDFNAVKPQYDKCVEKYRQKKNEQPQSEIIKEISSQLDDKEINGTTEKINEKPNAPLKKQNINEENTPEDTIRYLNAIDNDHIVINPMRVPKQGWLLKIYANSYEDYCRIVKDTLEDFKNNAMTIFLTKPDSFATKIKKAPFAVAYSVLINDKFSFISLKQETIQKLDEGNYENIPNKIKLSGRVFLEIVLFDAKQFTDKNGNLCDSNLQIMNEIKGDYQAMDIIESIGKNGNIVKYYIEIMTGLPSIKDKQTYKSVIIDADDTEDIQEILSDIDVHNLDFFVDTNQEDMKILFIHKSHLNRALKTLWEEEMILQINPSFDEVKYDISKL